MNILRRPFAEKAYGIPPEQAIGRSGKLRFELRDGKPILTKLPEINFYDDEAAKPIAIQNFLGRRPTAAFCNCERDLQMLQWSCDTIAVRFCLCVHHDDAAREWANDRQSKIGTLNKGLDEAKTDGWTVASMETTGRLSWCRNRNE